MKREGRFSLLAMFGAFVLAASLLSVSIVGIPMLNTIERTLVEQQTNTFNAVRQSRQQTIEDYFRTVRSQVADLAQNETIVDAAVQFSAAFAAVPDQVKPQDPAALRRYYEEEFFPRLRSAGGQAEKFEDFDPGSESARILQQMFIADNPYPVGRKQELVTSGIECEFATAHTRFHPQLTNFRHAFGYYDFFIFDTNGNVVYTAFKETDFATNVIDGPYDSSGLSQVFRAALAANTGTGVAIADFVPYAPSYLDPACFIGAPIRRDGVTIGVVAFQLSVDKLSEIMEDRFGLGETGETYLVGPDFLMRTNSRFEDASTILVRRVHTEPTSRALSEETGVMRTIDYRGVPVLSSFASLEVEGLEWVVLSEIDWAEVMAPVATMRRAAYIAGSALALLLSAVACFILYRLVSRPLDTVLAGFTAISEGEYETRVATSGSRELAQLAREFNRMAQAVETDIEERDRAYSEIKTLRGLLPICANCKGIRSDDGLWISIEKYIGDHTEAEFTHGICEECMQKLYPELVDRLDAKKNAPKGNKGK